MNKTTQFEWMLLNSPIKFKELSADPANRTVPANTVALYAKDSGGTSSLFFKDDAGTVHNLGTVVASLDDLTDVTITAAASGDYLRYNGSAWVDVTATQVATDLLGGSANTQVLFNDSGAFAGDASMTWNKTTNSLKLLQDAGAANLHLQVGNSDFVEAMVEMHNDTASGARRTSLYAEVNYVGASPPSYMQGILAGVFAGHTAGTLPSAAALYASAAIYGVGGTTTLLVGVDGGVFKSAGTATTAIALRARTPEDYGGTITNAYGLKVEDQTVGTNKWAIQTGTGTVRFGTLASASSGVVLADTNGDLSKVTLDGDTTKFLNGNGAFSVPSSGSSSASGHLHGVTRMLGDGATTTFNLPDIAEYLDIAATNGAVVDPTTYTLSADGTQIVYDVAPTVSHVLEINYVIAGL